MELEALKKDFISLIESDELGQNKELRRKMIKMTICNFFDYLEKKLSDKYCGH